MSEATLQKTIIDTLEQRGAWVAKQHQTGRGRRGIPDVLACYRGLFIAIEVKAPGSTTAAGRKEAQLRELGAVQTAGGHAMIATNVSKVLLLLDALDQVDVANQPTLPGLSTVVVNRLDAA